MPVGDPAARAKIRAALISAHRVYPLTEYEQKREKALTSLAYWRKYIRALDARQNNVPLEPETRHKPVPIVWGGGAARVVLLGRVR